MDAPLLPDPLAALRLSPLPRRDFIVLFFDRSISQVELVQVSQLDASILLEQLGLSQTRILICSLPNTRYAIFIDTHTVLASLGPFPWSAGQYHFFVSQCPVRSSSVPPIPSELLELHLLCRDSVI